MLNDEIDIEPEPRGFELEERPEHNPREPEVYSIQEQEEARLPYELDISYRDYDAIRINKIVYASTKAGMTEIITRDNYFITDGFSGELYCYINHGINAGTYIEATNSIERAIRQVAEKYIINDEWTTKAKRREVYDWINNGRALLESPDTRHLNIANGLIYLTPTGEFIDFMNDWTPQYLTTTKLPISFNAEAKCPAWEKFISEVFPEDAQEVAWEIAALLMLPIKNKAASAIILKGERNTGKTTFQNGILAFLGKHNVCNLSLDMFGERFQNTQLKGKLANVVGELPAIKLGAKAVNGIKRLIGNDMLQGEIKGGASFMFESYARCLFSCNEMPTCDIDDAFFDRFNIIPFNRRQFTKDPVKEQELKDSLSNPEELSGLLNKALAVLPRVMKQGVTTSSSMKEELDIVINENDPLISWIKDHIEVMEGSTILFTILHEAYKKAEPRDHSRQSDRAFGRAIKKLMPEGVRKTQLLLPDGTRPYGLKGVRFKEQAEQEDIEPVLEFDLETLVSLE